MKHQSNYPSVVKAVRETAEHLGIDLPDELLVQYGPPVDRFNQVLGAVASFLGEVNAKFETSKKKVPAKLGKR